MRPSPSLAVSALDRRARAALTGATEAERVVRVVPVDESREGWFLTGQLLATGRFDERVDEGPGMFTRRRRRRQR